MSITKEQVIETLREVVAGHEDYVYKSPEREIKAMSGPTTIHTGCWYADGDGAPSCIVGHVLAKLDPEGFQQIVTFEHERGESFGITETVKYDESEITESTPPQLDISGPAAVVLQAAQIAQDERRPWGQALGNAEYYARNN